MKKINQWFEANRLSLKIKKTKFALIHKNFSKDEISVKLPSLIIGNNNVERKYSIKFWGVIL